MNIKQQIIDKMKEKYENALPPPAPKPAEDRRVIMGYKVLERTPGGFISKMEITETTLDTGEDFVHTYYLEHEISAKNRNELIDKLLKKEGAF